MIRADVRIVVRVALDASQGTVRMHARTSLSLPDRPPGEPAEVVPLAGRRAKT